MKRDELARYIESRIYDINVDYQNVTNLCYEAKEFGFPSIQVFPCMIGMCLETIEGAPVAINSVISYPHGGFSIPQKAFEVEDAVRKGATEVEVVNNTREVKSHNYDYILEEMTAVKKAAAGKAAVKFNIEIECLTDEEAVKVCECAAQAGIDYIATSTGLYHTLDANKNDVPLVASCREVALLKKALDGKIKVQAEGYISDAQTAVRLIEAGADRISTEYAAKIMRQCER